MSRTSGLSTSDMHNLDLACRPITRAFDGHPPYLVGSAGESADYRDVDIRMILGDEEFDRLFSGRIELWALMSLSIGEWLRQRTGLPIDFQIQRQTEANEKHDKPRNPLGRNGGGRLYAGGGDATPFTHIERTLTEGGRDALRQHDPSDDASTLTPKEHA